MNVSQMVKMFADQGVMKKGHFIGSSGLHLDTYIDKDQIYSLPRIMRIIAHELGSAISHLEVDIVIGPAVGAIALAQLVAGRLCDLSRNRDIRCAYAEKNEEGSGFSIRPTFQQLISGKNVLVVEDILTTGGSANMLVSAVRALHGEVVGVGAIFNRGNVTERDLGNVPLLEVLIMQKHNAWSAHECPLCKKGDPVSQQIGHG